MTTEESKPPYALDVTPDSHLQFTLTRATGESASPRCLMTLKNPAVTDEYLAFKVKTTQPRRYLVRPNQGLVAPGASETISILLVDKDKQSLLQSYDRLGQSALDQSKDKFLVQSCGVSTEFATKFVAAKEKVAGSGSGSSGSVSGSHGNKELADALTTMWNTVSAGGAMPVYNKKLPVKHVVVEEGGAGGGAVGSKSSVSSVSTGNTTLQSIAAGGGVDRQVYVPGGNSKQQQQQVRQSLALENMTPEQMFAEVTTLRRKYDELVAFSVNLTGERDSLNNTLEQTKRDLNREMQARSALENAAGGVGIGSPMRGGGGGGGAGGAAFGNNTKMSSTSKSAGAGLTLTLVQVLVVALACLLAGIRGANMGSFDSMGSVPVLGGLLGYGGSNKNIETFEQKDNIAAAMGGQEEM